MSIAMCVVWLAVMSYVMSLSVEILAGHVGLDVTVAGAYLLASPSPRPALPQPAPPVEPAAPLRGNGLTCG